MFLIGHRITSLALAGVLCVGLSRNGMAQSADTVEALIIETVNLPVYRVKEPLKAPIMKSETKGLAPSKAAIWVPGFWDLQGDRNTGSRAGWVWVPGRWLTPPVRHARWDPAHWGWSDEWWSWIPGHWVQRGKHGYPPSLTSDNISQEETP
jgi:YXWGXW repeat-containing protein